MFANLVPSYLLKAVATILIIVAILIGNEGGNYKEQFIVLGIAYLVVSLAWVLSTNAAENIFRAWKRARITEYREGCEEALAYFKGEWNAVGNHPASRFLKEIEYFEEILGKS